MVERRVSVGVFARLVLAVALCLTACSSDDGGGEGDATEGAEAAAAGAASVSPADASAMTNAGFVAADPRLTQLRAIAEMTPTGIQASWMEFWDNARELIEAEGAEGQTLFAPTDEAFERMDPELLAVLLDPETDDEVRYAFLGYHFSSGLLTTSDEFIDGAYPTYSVLPGDRVQVTADPPTFGGHAVVQADILTSNGVVHLIDGVVIPKILRDAAE